MARFKSVAKRLLPAGFVVLGVSCLVPDPPPADKVPATLPEETWDFELCYRPVPCTTTDRRKLDLYHPNPNGPAVPVIVWVHGGGWALGDKRPAQKSILAQVPRGFAVVAINYRRTPEAFYPAAVEDVKLAVRWLKGAAAILKIKPDDIVLGGESAGGHLAALAAVAQGEFETAPSSWPAFGVKAVVNFVGPSNLTTFMQESSIRGLAGAWLNCPNTGGANPVYSCPASLLEEASVTTYLDSADPPVFMAYGELDPLVSPESQGRELAEQWASVLGKTLDQSEKVWFDFVEGSGHDVAPLAADMPAGSTEEQRKTYNFAALNAFLDAVAPR